MTKLFPTLPGMKLLEDSLIRDYHSVLSEDMILKAINNFGMENFLTVYYIYSALVLNLSVNKKA